MYNTRGLLLGLSAVGSIFAAADEPPVKRRRTGDYILSSESSVVSMPFELSEQQTETVACRLKAHSMNVQERNVHYNGVMNYPLDNIEAPEADDNQCEFIQRTDSLAGYLLRQNKPTQEGLTKSLKKSLKEFEGYLGKQQDARQRYISMNKGLASIQQILLGAKDDEPESIVASCESHIEQLQGAEKEKRVIELLKAATYLNISCIKGVCKQHPALPYTFKTEYGQEFRISKEAIVRFSGLIRDYVQGFESRAIKGHLQDFESVDTPFTMSFESDIVKPKALKTLLPILEQTSSVLIDRPIAKQGSYSELADLIIERNVDIDADLIALTDFFELDERVKQAIACAVIDQMEKKGLACGGICALLSNDLSLQNMLCYIAQQYYLIKGTVPEIFTEYIKEIGLTVRDLLVYEKARPTTANILNLDESYIRDLEGIADIPGVNQVLRLYLDNNKLQTTEGLNNLSNLRDLYLSYNQLRTIEELNNLPNLSVLDLRNNQLRTIEGLNLPSLILLFLEGNELQTTEGLNNLLNLEELHLDNNKLQTTEGLNNLLNLEELHLEGNELRTIEGLNNLPNLVELDLSYNQLRSIEGLNLPNLADLDLSHNPLQTLEWLNNLPNLQVLTLDKDQLPLIEELDLPNLSVRVRE